MGRPLCFSPRLCLVPYGRRIHLHDARPAKGRAPLPRDPQGHLPLVLPGREDRRAGRERRGQVDAAQDHGRRGPRLPRRGEAARRDQDRLPAAGAAARPRQGRARERRGRRGAPAQAARRLQRHRDEVRRAHGRRPDGEAARAAGPPAGADRPPGPLGAGPQARPGHGRAAPPAGRRGRGAALGRREAPRGALPAAALRARHAAARRAHQPPRRRERGVAGASPRALPGHGGGDHARSLLPRQRGRVDPRARPRPRHSLEGQLLLLA